MSQPQTDQDYFVYWRQEKERRQNIAQQQALQARASLPKLTNILVEQFHVTKVILFGSLVRGNFDGESDLDLAVGNLMPQDYFRAHAVLNDNSPFPVDLKPLEDLDDTFRIKVERMGECLYASNHSGGDRRNHH